MRPLLGGAPIPVDHELPNLVGRNRLASSGVHPEVVQTIMRHWTITLTMDTYGHLFPGQEADAVTQVEAMLSQAASRANVPEALKCVTHLQRAGCDHLVFGNS